MELPAPVLSAASRQANFTNEAGIDGTVRFLRNVTGLWLLQECVRHWDAAGAPDAARSGTVRSDTGRSGTVRSDTGRLGTVRSDTGARDSLDSLLAAAAAVPPLRYVIDADDPVFLPPGDMPARIGEWLSARGLPVPASRAEVARCVLDSLALAYRRALVAAQELSGRHADVVHIVGGGSRNELLCQLTADATGLPVVAGPAEATALGNVLVQARALGAAPATLAGMRALIRAGAELRTFRPSGDGGSWLAASRRIG
jgi:rhamnulokinase